MPGLAADGKGETLPAESAGRPLLPARLRNSLRLALGARLVLSGEDSDAWEFLEPPEGNSEATLEELLLRFACLQGPDGQAWNPLKAERLASHVLKPLRALASNPVSADSARPWLGRVILETMQALATGEELEDAETLAEEALEQRDPELTLQVAHWLLAWDLAPRFVPAGTSELVRRLPVEVKFFAAGGLSGNPLWMRV